MSDRVSDLWIDEKSPRASGEIPLISDERLDHLNARYAPLVFKDGVFHRIQTPDFRKVAYTYDPKLLDQVEFKELYRSQAVFPCGYYGFFKPSISEVLCQIPEQLMITMAANAYYIDLGSVKVFTSGEAQLAEVVWGRI